MARAVGLFLVLVLACVASAVDEDAVKMASLQTSAKSGRVASIDRRSSKASPPVTSLGDRAALDRTASGLKPISVPRVTSLGDPARRRRATDGGLDWNVIVDNLLVQAREYIVEEGKDEVSIPNIDEGFEKRFGFIKAHGRFEAWGGRVGRLSSIHRTGDVFFTSAADQSVTLTTHLGFGTVRVRYDGYKAEIWNFGPRGRIEASVGSNSVRLKLRMDITGEASCKLVLEEVSVERMDGFDVDVTGLGPLNWLTSKIVTWVAENRRGDIMANTESALRRALQRSVEKLPCDPAMINV